MPYKLIESANTWTEFDLFLYARKSSGTITSLSKSTSSVTTGSICFGSPTTIHFLQRNIAPNAICGDACPASSITNVPSTSGLFISFKNDWTDANVVEITGVIKNTVWRSVANAFSRSRQSILVAVSVLQPQATRRFLTLCIQHFEDNTNSLFKTHAS